MHVISRKALKDAARKFPDLEKPLDAWYRVARKARWRSLHDVRQAYGHADAVGECTVFNIKGRAYRLIVWMDYPGGRIFIRHILTHREYTQEGWKHDCG